MQGGPGDDRTALRSCSRAALLRATRLRPALLRTALLRAAPPRACGSAVQLGTSVAQRPGRAVRGSPVAQSEVPSFWAESDPCRPVDTPKQSACQKLPPWSVCPDRRPRPCWSVRGGPGEVALLSAPTPPGCFRPRRLLLLADARGDASTASTSKRWRRGSATHWAQVMGVQSSQYSADSCGGV